VRPRVVTVQGTASALESVAFIETSRVTVGAGSSSAKASLSYLKVLNCWKLRTSG